MQQLIYMMPRTPIQVYTYVHLYLYVYKFMYTCIRIEYSHKRNNIPTAMCMGANLKRETNLGERNSKEKTREERETKFYR